MLFHRLRLETLHSRVFSQARVCMVLNATPALTQGKPLGWYVSRSSNTWNSPFSLLGNYLYGTTDEEIRNRYWLQLSCLAAHGICSVSSRNQWIFCRPDQRTSWGHALMPDSNLQWEKFPSTHFAAPQYLHWSVLCLHVRWSLMFQELRAFGCYFGDFNTQMQEGKQPPSGHSLAKSACNFIHCH